MSAAENPGPDLPGVPQIVTGSAPNPRAIQPVGLTPPIAGMDTASEGPSGFDFGDLQRAFLRRWKIALGLGLLGAAVTGALTWYLMPKPQYTATALLQVREEAPKYVFPTAEAQTRFDTFQKTQKALIASNAVLAKALKDPKVADQPIISQTSSRGEDLIEALRKRLVVGFPPDSEILQISVSSEDREEAAILANAVLDSYMNLVVDAAHQERSSRLEHLTGLWDDYQQAMKQRRETLRTLARKAGSDDKHLLVAKSQLDYQQLVMIEQERLRVKAELIRLRAEEKAEQDLKVTEKLQSLSLDTTAAGADEGSIAEAVEKDPRVEQVRERLRGLMQRFENNHRLAKNPNDPSLTGLRKQIRDASEDLETARKEAGLHLRSQAANPRQAAGTAASNPLHIAEQIKILEEFGGSLEKEADELQAKLKEVNENTLDLEEEKEHISLLDYSAKKVGIEKEAMQVEREAPPRITIIDKAKPPTSLSNKKAIQATGLTSVAALASILFGISFWEVRARRINCMDQVVHGLGLRVVGSLPAQPPQASRRLLVGPRDKQQDWTSRVTESIDATRAMLLYASRVQGLRVVMVTSAQASEGKTTLASHLAASLARAGRRTILIDGDFRKPALHKVFDLPVANGLAELLRGDAALEDVIVPSPANNLSIIPAGDVDALAMEALGRGDLQGHLDALKCQYDFIIIDTAPVLPVADSLLLSQHVDAVILSILHDVSRIPSVQATYNRLVNLGVQILGAVVAGTHQAEHYGSDYKYYGKADTTKAS